MDNVDQIFIDLDVTKQLETGIKKYREDHLGKGDYVMDARVSLSATDNIKVAFIVNNVLNREYMVRPLSIQPPRTYAIQYTMTF